MFWNNTFIIVTSPRCQWIITFQYIVPQTFLTEAEAMFSKDFLSLKKSWGGANFRQCPKTENYNENLCGFLHKLNAWILALSSVIRWFPYCMLPVVKVTS